MNPNDDDFNHSDADDESDIFFLMQAYQYHQLLQQQ